MLARQEWGWHSGVMATAEAPAISVVMPLYNRASSVRRAVDSVLVQEFTNFELVIVDDGSTDGSAEAVEGIADPRIRLIRLPENRGGNAARNEGVRQARGQIISFLDSDDEYLPHKLQHVADMFAAHPGLGGMIDSFRKLYPGTSRAPRDRHNPALSDRDALLKALFHRRIWKATPGVSATRDAVLAAGGFDETLKRRQDFDFLIRLIRTAPFRSDPTISWLKTNSEDGISADLDRYMNSFVAFWDRHPDYYDNPDFRGGFAADLNRHLSKLLARGRFGQIARDVRPVVDRIGWGGLLQSLAQGRSERRALGRERRAA